MNESIDLGRQPQPTETSALELAKNDARDLRIARASEKSIGRQKRSAVGEANLAHPPASWQSQTGDFDWVSVGRRRRGGFALRFVTFVVLPTALVAAYMFLYASPRYVSELQLTYQTDSSNSKTVSGGGMLSSLLAPTVGVDISSIISAYLTSSAALGAVEEKLKFRDHYSDPRIDYFSRLGTAADTAHLLRYYASRVSVSQQLGGYVTIDIEAFTPEYAQAVGRVLADACDKMFSEMTDRSRQDQVKFADKQLSERKERLRKATLDMITFRNDHRNFDPSTDATQLGTVVGGLEQQLSLARSDLTNSQKFLQDSSPTIVAQKAKIDALSQQIGLEKSRLANPNGQTGGSTTYSQLISEYVAFTQELQFATDSYTSAKQTLDLANAEAAKKTQYVLVFVPPNLPIGGSWSDGIKYTISTLLVSLFLYASGSLLIGAFRDRAGS
jgi:capsular polysaccharide transport system permease protein